MNENEIRKMILDLTESQLFAVLSSIGADGSPYCNIVGFLLTEDLSKLVFATPRDTRKFINIQRDPRVSILIDSRSNQETDFEKASAVTITGTAKEVIGNERDRYSEKYLSKNPKLADFVQSNGCALILVETCKFWYVNRFQKVQILEIAQ